MFGMGKNSNTLEARLERLGALFRATGQEQTVRLEECARAAAQSRLEQFNALSGQLAQFSAAVNRHDLAIGDLLDSWEELQEKQQAEIRALDSSLTKQLRLEAQEGLKREAALLNLVMACHDQLYALLRGAEEAGDETWVRQLHLAGEKLSDSRIPAGVQVIDRTGVPVNYDLHEVLYVEETDRRELSMLVASVYTCGYAFRGRILRKAGVSVYRYGDDRSETPEQEMAETPEGQREHAKEIDESLREETREVSE